MNEHRLSQLVDKARYYIDHEMWLHATQIYTQLIAAFPDESSFHLDLATIYMEMGNLSAAEQTLLRALNRDSRNPDIVFALGLVFYRAGDLERAKGYLEKLLTRRLPKVHHTLGLICQQRNDLHGAERNFRLTLEIDPDYPLAGVALAKTLLQLHEADKALPILEKEVARQPDTPDIQTLIGMAHAMNADWKAAIRTFDELLDAHPEDVRALLGSANAWMQLRKSDEAAPLLQRALTLSPESASVHVHLGMLALLRSDKRKAAQCFSRALEIDPENHDALHQMRLLHPDDQADR